MPTTVNIHEAKTHLSRLLARVSGGDEIIIAKNGEPMAMLMPIGRTKARKPGKFQGEITGIETLLEPASPSDTDLWTVGHPADPMAQPAPTTP